MISSKDVTGKEFCTDIEITIITRSKGQVELYQAKALFISGKLKEPKLIIGALSLFKPLKALILGYFDMSRKDPADPLNMLQFGALILVPAV